MLFESGRPIALFDVLARSAPNKVFAFMVLGAMAGFANALIIPIVLLPMEPQSISELPAIEARPNGFDFWGIGITAPRAALAFVVICVFILITNTGSQVILRQVQVSLERKVREYLYQRVALLPILDLERIGSPRLQSALTMDVRRMVAGSVAIPNVIVNVIRVLGLLALLLYLNVHVFTFLLGTLVFGVVTYRVPVLIGVKVLTLARDAIGRIQEGITGLVYGAKELKLNRRRREAFLQEALLDAENAFQRHEVRGGVFVLSANTYSDLLGFIAIGVLTFGLSAYYNLTIEQMMSSIMVVLFISGPIRDIMNASLPITQGVVSLRALHSLLKDMPFEERAEQLLPSRPFSTVRLEAVVHRYVSGSTFQVGPIDLTLRRGEVTFLVGGNGSGKTTLGKLISLHYHSQSGRILFDDVPISEDNRESYRQVISAIYSDFYLFTKLFGLDAEDLRLCATYLQKLRLDHAVTVSKEGQLSSIALSDGQRKRLALLVTYLEDRTICVFDEWAADQDPQFKQIFYAEIVPALKRAGKLVVIISHDDRFFRIADQIVKMENGKIDAVGRTKIINGVAELSWQSVSDDVQDIVSGAGGARR